MYKRETKIRTIWWDRKRKSSKSIGSFQLGYDRCLQCLRWISKSTFEWRNKRLAVTAISEANLQCTLCFLFPVLLRKLIFFFGNSENKLYIIVQCFSAPRDKSTISKKIRGRGHKTQRAHCRVAFTAESILRYKRLCELKSPLSQTTKYQACSHYQDSQYRG